MAWTGSAPNQTFQRTDGTRTGSQTWQEADAASVDIISTDHDTHDQDMADGISACLKKDGGNAATANIPMGGFRLTNLGTASARTHSASAADVQDNKLTYCTVGGTANAISLTSNSVTISTYATGQVFRFFASYTNTDAVTVAVDGLSAKDLKVAGTALSAGQIVAGAWITIAYDGTDFEMAVGTTPAAVSVGTVMAWTTATIPTGWLECDGSAVSRTTYSALFGIIAATYGSGDGSTTFNLPDYRGYFLRGHDDGEGVDPNAATRTDRGDGTTGDYVGTKQTSAYKSHTHTGTTDNDGTHTHNSKEPDPLSSSGAHPTGSGRSDPTGYATNATTGSGIHQHDFTTDSSGGSETRPVNVYVKWIILALPSASISVAQVAPYFSALTADRAGTNGTSAQAVFGTSEDAITLPASTGYFIEGLYYITRAAGTTSHTTSLLFGGTATYTSILYTAQVTSTTGAPAVTSNPNQVIIAAATATAVTSASTSGTENLVISFKGIMRINGSGTVIPQFQYSAAPGGAPTVKANSYIKLTPMGADTVSSYGAWG